MKNKNIFIYFSIILICPVCLFSDQNNVFLEIKLGESSSSNIYNETTPLEYSVKNNSKNPINILTNTPVISSGLWILLYTSDSNNITIFPSNEMESEFRISRPIIVPLLPNCTLTKKMDVPKKVFLLHNTKDRLIGKIRIAEDGKNGPIVYDIYSQPISGKVVSP
jgi:hypothetical protein